MHICTLIYIYYINNTCNTHYTYTYEQINSPAPFTTSPPNPSMFFIYLVPIPQNLALLPPQSFTSQNFSFSLTTPNKMSHIFFIMTSLSKVSPFSIPCAIIILCTQFLTMLSQLPVLFPCSPPVSLENDNSMVWDTGWLVLPTCLKIWIQPSHCFEGKFEDFIMIHKTLHEFS